MCVFVPFAMAILGARLLLSKGFRQKQWRNKKITQEVEKLKKKRRFKTVIALMAVLLCVCVMLSSEKTVHASAEATQTETLSLHRNNPDENLAFQMTNLFPGDSETRYYRVKVSYTGTVTVFFQAKSDEDGEKLGEVLMMKVRMVETDEVLYEGSIAEMPILEHNLTTDSKAQTDEICYEITISLGTEVGNEYQNKRMNADLIWWAEGSEEETAESTEGEISDSTEDETSDSDGGETSESTDSGSGSGGELVDPPDTGDHQSIIIWMICIVLALAVMTTGMYGHHRRILSVGNISVVNGSENRQIGIQKKRKKFWLITITLMLILMAFGITSMALIYQKVSVDDNLFQTGKVNICLNDDRPVFDEEILFEPGMRIVKTFTLRNDSTCDVYYRLYFAAVEGDFAKALEIEVKDGEKIIFSGKMAEMNGEKPEGADGMLLLGETRNFSITFYVPENCGNLMQNQTLLFDLNADAVQAVNNPSEKFD